jgi:hypothetical protein
MTKSAIETALEWEPGSVDAVLDGRNPTVAARPVEGADDDLSLADAPARLMHLVLYVRRHFGEEVAHAMVDRGFALPADRSDNDETPTDRVSAAG